MPMHGFVRVVIVGLVVAMACGDGADPPVETTSSTTSTSASTGTTSPDTTVASTDTTVASTDTTVASTDTTVGVATLGTTTEPPPPPPDCQSRGCEDPDHWCVIFETVEDTDGSDSLTAECLPFPPRCEGLTNEELELCLEPLCCPNFGCVWNLDVEQMELVCHTDPGVSCGRTCA